jgi:hypothetical protein
VLFSKDMKDLIQLFEKHKVEYDLVGGFAEKEGRAIHLGVEPNRIDLLTHLKGITNEKYSLEKTC